jgi:clan AA aspartic protease
MIEGAVNNFHEPVVDLVVKGPTGQELQLEFLIDTGFGGELTLHSSVAAALELHPVGAEQAVLADGSVITFPIADALLHWDGTFRRVKVGLADTVPLMGMRVLEGHELQIHAIPDGLVRISAIPA